ncbi:hypothetical protein GUJ93_ZPchr0011g27664 [Zizania palustris]|uniref:Uncharacterized protein n=1 Tax=Zizania palustris TaxID=103762 RepID=A0A8J5WLW4_ZIZPA|nr:hypothetical protein GUJ93_ZPchr0011g27664 [Zizania palustris]
MGLFPQQGPVLPQQDLNEVPFGGNQGWDPWPEEQAIQPHAEQQQEEISIQISGLSNAIASSSSLMSGSSINNVVRLNTGSGSGGCQVEQPRVAPLVNFRRPEITLVYKRRQRDPAASENSSPANSNPGGSRRLDKGKVVCLPGQPSLQDLAQATSAGLDDQAATLGGVLRITPRGEQDNTHAAE